MLIVTKNREDIFPELGFDNASCQQSGFSLEIQA